VGRLLGTNVGLTTEKNIISYGTKKYRSVKKLKFIFLRSSRDFWREEKLNNMVNKRLSVYLKKFVKMMTTHMLKDSLTDTDWTFRSLFAGV